MRWAGIGLFSTLRILATAAVRYVRFTSTADLAVDLD
jgi:hypothetical protein